MQVAACETERDWELRVGNAAALTDAVRDTEAVAEADALGLGVAPAVDDRVPVPVRESDKEGVGGVGLQMCKRVAVPVRERLGALAVAVWRSLGTPVGVRVRLPVRVPLNEVVRATSPVTE